nr:gastrula zinc finger protein XlCGF48.2 isoform X6 [Nothobranchius furzeri]
MMESEQERSRFRERKPKNKINHVFNRKAALHRFDIDAPDDWEPKQGSEPINIKEEEEEVETSLEGEQLKMTPVPLKSEDGEEEPLISQIHRHQMKGRDLPIISSADEESCRGAETTWHPGLNTHEDGPSSPETEDIHEDAWDNDDDQQRALSIDAPDGWGPNIVQQGSETLNIKEEETGLEGEQLNETSVPLKSEDREEKPQISQIYLHQMRGRDLPISSSANEECWRGAETTWNPDVNTPEDGPNSPETEDSDEDAWDNDALPADVLQVVVGKEEVPEDWRPDVNQQEPELLKIKEEKEKLWTSLEDQLGGINQPDATRFSFNVATLKSEGEDEPLIAQIHQHQMEGRDLSISSSAEQMEVKADEDYCGGAETTRSPKLNTDNCYSSSETEDSEDDEEVDDKPHMQLKLLSQPGFKTEDTIHTGPKSFCYDPCDESSQNMNFNAQEGQKVFACDVCSQSFSLKSHLNRHMKVHTGQKPFCCDVCQQSFTRKTNLNTHMKIHTAQKRFSCGVCGRPFRQKMALNRHMVRHTGQKPFCCNVCGQRFTQKENLNTHMKIHTGQKMFGCDVCGQRFTRKANLSRHMRTHTGQKPFSCDICGQCFSQKTHLNMHMRSHTGQKPFVCDVCRQKFTRKANLNKHMRIHTGQKQFS